MAGQKDRRDQVAVKVNDRFVLVQADDIIHASLVEDSINIVTTQVSGTSNDRTLEELHARLDPDVFWRVHRSHLVNINKIDQVFDVSGKVPRPSAEYANDYARPIVSGNYSWLNWLTVVLGVSAFDGARLTAFSYSFAIDFQSRRSLYFAPSLYTTASFSGAAAVTGVESDIAAAHPSGMGTLYQPSVPGLTPAWRLGMRRVPLAAMTGVR